MIRLGQGSSKDLWADPNRGGVVEFEFTDRVSVFDYGALPDLVAGKGRALTRFGAKIFEWLDEASISHAFIGITPEGRMQMRAASHPKFREIKGEQGLRFVPLELIFRWGAPEGSSLLKRDPSLKPGARFDTPLIECSTKLEASDRLLDNTEAEKLANGPDRLAALRELTTEVAQVLKTRFDALGLDLWDGKIEAAWDTIMGRPVVVDAVTPDELRLSLKGASGVPLSKELLRQWISATNWAFEVSKAKASFGPDWRASVSAPPRLGAWRLERIGSLYESLARTLDDNSAASLWNWVRTEPRKPKVMIVGNGGREAALKWRLEREGCEIIDRAPDADAVWVSPDEELARGDVDRLDKDGAWSYGPRGESARIESSKAFGKDIAAAAGVELARFERDAAKLREFSEPPVVKLDGLAAGKGVIVPRTWAEAEGAVKEFEGRGPIVLEEKLEGFEASAFFSVTTGYNRTQVRFLGSARDFKRRFAGDEGPNTGGMGAWAPHPDLTADDIALFTRWAESTASALTAQELAYNGILYLGLMKDRTKGWKLLEYNARFGDPETEALVRTWPEGERVLRPLLGLDLKVPKAIASDAHALCLALVRPEYPSKAAAAALPDWSDAPKGECTLFRNASATGRVAFLVGAGPTLRDAGDRVFEALVESPWKGLLEWRADIIP